MACASVISEVCGGRIEQIYRATGPSGRGPEKARCPPSDSPAEADQPCHLRGLGNLTAEGVEQGVSCGRDVTATLSRGDWGRPCAWRHRDHVFDKAYMVDHGGRTCDAVFGGVCGADGANQIAHGALRREWVYSGAVRNGADCVLI
jgi:hypothetical protein